MDMQKVFCAALFAGVAAFAQETNVVEPADTTAAQPVAEPVAVAEPTADTAAVVTAVATPVEPVAEEVAPVEKAAAPQEAPTEKRWFNVLGVGITVPVSQYKAHDQKIDLLSYGMTFNYLGMARGGFSIEFSLATGGSATDNIKFVDSEDDWQIGTYSSFDFGLGYTFGVGKKFSLSLLAVSGFQLVTFESDKKEYRHGDLGKVDRSFSEVLGAFTLGGDIFAQYSFTEHIGLYAGVGGRWTAVVASASSVRYDKDDFTRTDTNTDDEMGNYSIVPVVGVMWKF